MPQVSFTSALKRFFPDLEPQEVSAGNVAELLGVLDARFPGLRNYLVDERGRLRKHVNIYIGEDLVEDREALTDAVKDGDRVLIFQALSGG